jgi:hypothetical protein
MQPCNGVYYCNVYWRLNIFRAVRRSSSGAPTVFAASGLHTHVVTGRSQVWVGTIPPFVEGSTCFERHTAHHQELQLYLQPLVYTSMRWLTVVKSEWELQFPLRLDYGRSPHAYVNHRPQIKLVLMMMSGMPLETCWAFNERCNNKFYYKVASCWLFVLSHFINYFSVFSLSSFPLST